ncbi:MAG: hypothetical protein A2086_08415 [Spirochaetes bacterium GWD1_27_9]|nr:MAG: hypothetical protein A2Z98_00190 [Spirochaetes bacterium GWB1_27_13]OHD20824.1 MAG: hypothetical protein A2Y34_12690 [Spirochaetes bacterium GWC1_27_15]OHD30605.1 MAG: hypothetical protein A2086_08415 [Spirochaetes bacterium GWD1_27_9]
MIGSYIVVFFLAVGLAMDAFAVCVSYGVCHKEARFRAIFRLSFHTALFQVLMPLLGWIAGTYLGKVVSKLSPWIAFILLLIIGIKMLVEAFEKKEECEVVDFSKGKHLIFVCIATSIDAFAAGLSLGLLNLPPIVSLTMIGVITFILSMLGVYLGKVVGFVLGKGAEITGGIILILIGVKIIVENLFFKV